MSDGNVERLTVSHRDEDELGAQLTVWLAARPEVGADLRVENLSRPETNGMSSETLLFDASWKAAGSGGHGGPGSGDGVADGGRHTGRYVARLRPTDEAFPIFPTYDLERQVRVMRLIAERTTAPVPRIPWYEPDESTIGTPFFVMDRVDGVVPPDVMPYTFDGSWVSDATPEQRARLQATTVDALAAIHGVEAEPAELAFLHSDVAAATGAGTGAGARPGAEPRRSPLRAHFAAERAYYDWARGDLRYPVLERAFAWLEAHWPEAAEAAPAVVCWGDARIGNVLYRDFEPQAVLDWEMATLGPRELDLAWCVFIHRFFQDLTTDFEMAGLPDFLDRHTVAQQYAERTGHEPRDFDWFLTYAAVRYGTVMIRAVGRGVFLGEREAPDDHEELVMHRATIDALVDGTYWPSLA